jgi:DNA-binding transcriptional ArsR family regulator
MSPLEAHSDVFQAIANPVRRALLDRLRAGEQPVLTLAEPFRMSVPAVSQQLQILRRANLVRERRHGRQRLYRLNPEPLRDVRDWMRHYEQCWTRRLRTLGTFLDRKQARR